MGNNPINKTSEEIAEGIASDIFDNIEKAETDDIAKEIVKAQYKNRIKSVIEDDDSKDNFDRSFNKTENASNGLKIVLVLLVCWLFAMAIIAALIKM